MYLYNLLQNLPSLASIVEPDTLTVYPDLPLLDAIALMSQELKGIAPPHRALLVVENERLVGIVTDRDLVELTTTQADLQGLKVADVMTEQPHRLVLTSSQTVLSAVSIFQQYQIGHLPIVDAQGHLLGLVTIDLIRQIFQPTVLLQSRSVREVMTAQVIYAMATATILQVAQLMVEHRVSSIVIVDSAKTLQPLGIVTKRDIVQFQMLEVDMARQLVGMVMSKPLFCIQPEDSLQSAQQMMAQRQIRRLGVTGTAGELVGIISESNLLGSIDITTSDTPVAPTTHFPVVGIGASAGGLEAFRQLLSHLPIDTGMAFVLIQHLDPSQKSLLSEILALETAMPVLEVTNGIAITPNCVYAQGVTTKL